MFKKREIKMAITVKTKSWGNSTGLIIPSDIVKNLRISPGEEIMISIQKKENTLKELFGSLKFKRNPSITLKEVRGNE